MLPGTNPTRLIMDKGDKTRSGPGKAAAPQGQGQSRLLSVVAAGSPPALIEGATHVRNAGTPLHVDWFDDIKVNLSAAERRAATIVTRRSVKKEYQAAWLVKAVQCIDLTTLSGDDTPGRVRRLAMKARRPIREDIVAALGLADDPPKV